MAAALAYEGMCTKACSKHLTALHSPTSNLDMQVRLRGSVSSQYLTALLMAAPLAEGQGSVDLIISDELVSQPYVAMTVSLMARFGIEVSRYSSHGQCRCACVNDGHNEQLSGSVQVLAQAVASL